MGTIVVGYVPKPEGDAALDRAIEEAKLRGDKLVVVNSHRGGREFDRDESAKTLITEDDLRGLEPGARLRISEQTKFTPLAQDIVSDTSGVRSNGN